MSAKCFGPAGFSCDINGKVYHVDCRYTVQCDGTLYIIHSITHKNHDFLSKKNEII